MFNVLKENVNENQEKDFRKLSKLVSVAKGYRTINGFAADCRTNADYIADIINLRITSYPTIKFLDLIANNSEGRITLKELKMACGYSLYDRNDMDQIKNIHIRRGWLAYCNFGDSAIDSEYGGYRLVLIIQNDVGNYFSSTTLVCPITSRKKTSLPTHVNIGKEHGLQYDSIISTEQTRCISKRRLLTNGCVEKIAECSEELMLKVEIALMKSEGIIDINTNEQEAIEALSNLRKSKSSKYENNHNKNYNFGARPQVAFA